MDKYRHIIALFWLIWGAIVLVRVRSGWRAGAISIMGGRFSRVKEPTTFVAVSLLLASVAVAVIVFASLLLAGLVHLRT